jgi:hypothetical protein
VGIEVRLLGYVSHHRHLQTWKGLVEANLQLAVTSAERHQGERFHILELIEKGSGNQDWRPIARAFPAYLVVIAMPESHGWPRRSPVMSHGRIE